MVINTGKRANRRMQPCCDDSGNVTFNVFKSCKLMVNIVSISMILPNVEVARTQFKKV